MLPDKDRNILKFKNWKNKQDAPFVIYADFESILQKTTDVSKPQKHIASAYSYAVVRCDGVCTSQKTYRGKDLSNDFIKSLLKEQTDINRVFFLNPPRCRNA